MNNLHLTPILSAQVAEVAKLDIAIEKMEADLSAIKEARDRLINLEIPNSLDLMGVASLVLEDGTTACIETLTNAKILNRDEFFAYLEETGQAAIIKTAEPTINAMTLKAWARRVDRSELPEGLIEISEFRRAKVGKK
jgi:hypothetical protein